jgi:hypothetical protein
MPIKYILELQSFKWFMGLAFADLPIVIVHEH